MTRPRKLHVVSFGCQMSSADGEEMARPLLARGLASTDALEEADAVLLNTCTVRQHAEDRALSFIGRLREWKEADPGRLLIVAGCAAERLGPWLQRRFPFIDLVVGAKSIEEYPKILDAALAARFDGPPEDAPGLAGLVGAAGVSQYLTVMRGCNYTCTYCIVPAVRGRERYRAKGEILAEARARADAGARELVLLGQTVNSWKDGGDDFADLLRAVASVGGVERVRFMSPHPRYLTPRLVEAMAEVPQVCPHLHLPAQSGSDRVLALMRRNYTAQGYLRRVSALRAAVPDIAVTTDFIAGFPTETDADFEATLALHDALDPMTAYCFAFSPREGTEAAAMEDQVPEAVRADRLRRLIARVEANGARHLAAWVGKRVRVLLEDETDGRTEHSIRARVDRPGAPGEVVQGVVGAVAGSGLAVTRAVATKQLETASEPLVC